MAVCDVCFRHCEIGECKTGYCLARTCKDGKVIASNYGKATALALDPIEKKPLARFYPGSMILSYGSYGCNLRCPFCQNSDISWGDGIDKLAESSEDITPEGLAKTALSLKDKGNIGIAFTYNEPLVSYEFVRDTAKISKGLGMKNVLVTNGTAELRVLEELLPYIDAMNVDLKGFTDRYYKEVLHGDRRQVMDFVEMAAKSCHIEITTLIVPGENDTEDEIREISSFIAGLESSEGDGTGKEIPLHITRFFPSFKMQDRGPTETGLIYRLCDVAQENLKYVYHGNC